MVDLEAHASYLRAESLTPLAGFLPQQVLRERLRDLAPTGEWTDASLLLLRAGAEQPWRMRVHAAFRGAGFAAAGRAPGMRGLSGTLNGDQGGGRVDLDSHALSIAWPYQWQQPVALDALSGTLYWRRAADELLVASPAIIARNKDAALHLQAAWRQSAGADSPELTVVGGVENGDLTAARNYMPRAILPPKTLEWLDHAFVAGRAPHADVVFKGPVRHFPFRDGSGLFLAHVQGEGVTISYQPDWPPLENLAGQAEFRNEGMTATLSSGDLATGKPGG